MVKHPAHRLKKYKDSLDPDKIRMNLMAHKDTMVEQQSSYFGEIVDVEEKAKRIVEGAGVTTYEVAQYVNVARKCYSLAKRFKGQTLIDESQWVVNHWASRGLLPALLARVCNISGCNVSAPVPPDIPTACTLGNLLVCGPDGWQELVPGVASTFLHSQGPGVIPNWQAGITDHGALAGLGDDDHTQYVLRSILAGLGDIFYRNAGGFVVAGDHGDIGGLGGDDHTQYVLRSILTQHGDLFYRDGAGIQRLAPGVAGRVLSTQGVGAPPQWIAGGAGDPRVPRGYWGHGHTPGQTHFPCVVNENYDDSIAEVIIPDNWNGTSKVYAWFLGTETYANNYIFRIDVGTHGEAYTTHNQTTGWQNLAIVNTQYYRFDLTALLSVAIGNILSEDVVRLTVDHQGDSYHLFIGLEIQET